MKKTLSLAVLMLGLLYAVATAQMNDTKAAPTTPQKRNLVVGEIAPEFSLKDQHGETRSLSDFKGEYVVLEWFNFKCPVVRNHYDSKNMQKQQQKWVDRGVVWLLVDSTAPGQQGHMTPERALKQMQEEGTPATAVLLDPEGKVGRAYHAKVTPHLYIIDPNGVLIYQGAVDSEPSTDPADISEADQYIDWILTDAHIGEGTYNGKMAPKTTKPYGCPIKFKQ